MIQENIKIKLQHLARTMRQKAMSWSDIEAVFKEACEEVKKTDPQNPN